MVKLLLFVMSVIKDKRVMKQNNLIKIGNGIANRINSIDIIVVNEKLIVDSIDKFIRSLK